MVAKALLLKRLSKMHSNITHVCYHHLNNLKNAPLRVHHVASWFTSIAQHRVIDNFWTQLYLKQNTISHNPVKVSDPSFLPWGDQVYFY